MKMQRGFTLIELMITVAVIAILAAIAIPSYQKYRLKTNRPIGEQCLVEAQRRIENAYAHLNSYPATTLNSPSYGYSSDPVNCGDPPYVYTVSLSFPASATCPAAACYQLTASPSPSQAKDGTLLLTYNAQKLDPSQRFYKQHIPPGSSTPVTTWDFQPGQ